MAYKYFLTTNDYQKTTGSLLLQDFQAFVDREFYNAPDAFVIQEEAILGSGSFVDVDVRINRVISQITGEKLGDDFKQIIFKDLGHSASMGTKYYFDNNYFVTVNSEILKNFAASCTLRRCNNVLRWIDENGVYYEEPCSIEYKISRPRDLMGTENLVLPQGYIDVYCQLNSKTKKIKGNQRFIFGPPENRVAFKTFGDGVKNYLNQQTFNDSSGALLQLSMGGNFVNPDVDNLTLGIADYYKNYSNLTSGSNIGVLDIVSNPNTNYILESGSALYDVRYYSGSTIHSGSFVFSVSGSMVPVDHYAFAQESNNTFSIYNLEKYPEYNLNILCSGSSGSRILSLELRGAF